jgi:hypothetical protein
LEDFPYPIWSIDNELQIKLISKVQDVISNKEKNENSDTTSLELEIDHLVYKIYDLTPEDINIVENSIKK